MRFSAVANTNVYKHTFRPQRARYQYAPTSMQQHGSTALTALRDEIDGDVRRWSPIGQGTVDQVTADSPPLKRPPLVIVPDVLPH